MIINPIHHLVAVTFALALLPAAVEVNAWGDPVALESAVTSGVNEVQPGYEANDDYSTTTTKSRIVGWWDDAWKFRYPVTVMATPFSREVRDVRVQFKLMGADPKDIDSLRVVDGLGDELPYHVLTFSADRMVDLVFRLNQAGTRFVYIYSGNAAAPKKFYSVVWKMGRALIDGGLPEKGARHGKWIWEQEGRARIHLGIAPLNGNRNGHSITSMDPLRVTNKMVRLSQYVYIDPDDPPRSIEMELIFNKTTVRLVWGNMMDLRSRAHPFLRGELPKAGEWIKIDIVQPNLPIKKDDRLIGLGYYQVGGRLKWGPTYLGSILKTGQIETAESFEGNSKSLATSEKLTDVLVDQLSRILYIDLQSMPTFVRPGRKELFSIQIDSPSNPQLSSGKIDLYWKEIYEDGDPVLVNKNIIFPSGDAFYWSHVFQYPKNRVLKKILVGIQAKDEIIRSLELNIVSPERSLRSLRANGPYLQSKNSFVIFDSSQGSFSEIEFKPNRSAFLLGKKSLADEQRNQIEQSIYTEKKSLLLIQPLIYSHWPMEILRNTDREKMCHVVLWIDYDLIHAGLKVETSRDFLSDCVELIRKRGSKPVIVLGEITPVHRQLQYDLRARAREVANEYELDIIELEQ